MKRSYFLLSMLLLTGSLLFVSCDNDDDTQDPLQNAVEFVESNPDYTLLYDALVKTGLDATLSTDGPFTIFAPNDESFQAFLDNAGTNSIENTPADILADILTYHVIGGEFRSSNLTTGYINTASASKFDAAVTKTMFINNDNGVTINGTVDVTAADIDISNGVIHAVSAVIEPANIVTFATADETFSILVEALTLSGLTTDFVSVLSGEGPFTVFAPTNSAFEALLANNSDWNSLNDIPVDVLEKVLLYHVTDAGNVQSKDLTDGQIVPTLASGETLEIDLSGSAPQVIAASNSAEVILADVQATNGVIHAINAVLLPE